MKFRMGLMIGGAAGYYFGAKAGRQRYYSMNRALRRIRSTEAVEQAREKAKAVIDLTIERAKDAVSPSIDLTTAEFAVDMDGTPANS